MSNVFTREELLSILRKQEMDFIQHMQERIKSRKWKVTFRSTGVTTQNGNIYINNDPTLLAVIGQMVSEASIDGVLSFIDILSNSNSADKSTSELEELKSRISRLELELFKMLPPDFTNPSTESPSNN